MSEYKVKNMKLKNFHKFDNFEIEFDGKVTKLVGINGSGKTTVGLTAIWAGLKGIAERGTGNLPGERWRFIGNRGKSADIKLTLLDTSTGEEIYVNNHITKATNDITFTSKSGEYNFGENWLHNLLNMAFLSTKHFTQLSGKEQAIALGIDTSSIDTEIKEAKEELSYSRKVLKNITVVEEIEKVERVSVKDLNEKIRAANEHNAEIEQCKRIIDEADSILERVEQEIGELKDTLKRKEDDLKIAIEKRKELPDIDVPINIDPIYEKIEQAEKINQDALNYENYLAYIKSSNNSFDLIESAKEAVKMVETKKLDYIKSFDFGFNGLDVNDNGELEYSGKPIKEPHFSRGELEVIVATLYTKMNPSLKYRFIDDFESLDEANQEKVLNRMLESGLQVVTAEVRGSKDSKDAIMLRECKIETKQSENKETLL